VPQLPSRGTLFVNEYKPPEYSPANQGEKLVSRVDQQVTQAAVWAGRPVRQARIFLWLQGN
jgi:hypothetical protein